MPCLSFLIGRRIIGHPIPSSKNYTTQYLYHSLFDGICKEKRHPQRECLLLNWQLPILPVRLQTSTFGVYVLNYCVRYGNRWNHIASVTRYSFWMNHVHSKLYRRNAMYSLRTISGRVLLKETHSLRFRFARSKRLVKVCASLRSFKLNSLLKLSPRLISIGPLHALRHFHSQPIYLVFFKESY